MRPKQLFLLVNHRHQRRQARLRSPEQHIGRIGLSLVLILTLFAALAAIVLSAAYAELTRGLPSIQILPVLLDSRDGILLQPTTLFDRTGRTAIYKLENPGIERQYLLLDPQQPQSLAPQLVQVVITLLDPDFWQHPGFNLQHLTQVEPSTLAERLVLDLLLEKESADLRRALRMRLLAAQITRQYGRARVLEWYLNSASFGHLAYGAESAAQLYLGKSARQLSLAEAALLATTLDAPALNPVDATQAALERRQSALDRLVEGGIMDAEQREKVRDDSYTPPALTAPVPFARTFTTLVVEQLSNRLGRQRVERGGMRVVTSLDMDLQEQLACTLQTQLFRIQGGSAPTINTCQAARLLPTLPPAARPLPAGVKGSAVLLDPTNGQILAFVGDATTIFESPNLTRHEPGTSLTPFLAVAAFASGFGPASLTWDIPPAAPVGNPKPITAYRGPLRLRTALANDVMPPLNQILDQIEAANVWRLAEPLGLTQLNRSPDPHKLLEENGDSSILELAQAYGVFATLGTLNQSAISGDDLHTAPSIILRAEDLTGQQWINTSQIHSRAVLSESLAYLVHHVLSDEVARWPSLGHPNALEIGRPAGAKIGTTSEGNQVWTAGYTPQRVAVVWLGLPTANQTEPTLDRRYAAGIWHAVMQYAHRDIPATGWNQPAGISNLDVCEPSGMLPTRACPSLVSEIFLNGNEPVSYDTLYQVFPINRETNRLATVFTPPELIEERTFMVIPSEAQAWGRLAGLPIPPADYDLIQAPLASADVQINQPLNFSSVRGKIIIRGSAAGSGFSAFRVQAGAGLNPRNWVQIGQDGTAQVRDGILATWDTPAESGLYALRLQVIRQDQRVETAIIQVTVDNTPPRVRILTPFTGQKIKAGGSPFTLQAEVLDAIGIQKVEFWMDGLLIGQRQSAPFSHPWQPLPGSHTLVVKAMDQAGNSSESLPLTFTVD